MNSGKIAIVVTSIQEPTPSMKRLAVRANLHQLQWFVIGDVTGPREFVLPPAELVTIQQQRQLPFKIATLLPERHYARKNLGYLLAIERGCECIYETDDDNAPTDAWDIREVHADASQVQNISGFSWANVYSNFTSKHIWPRGLPLNCVRRRFEQDFRLRPESVHAVAPIQQGLANGSPDVDSIWRLVLDSEITFDHSRNVLLPRGVWCPFNSQNTWWWRQAFPLLYLPSYCSFRVTDIWRSFVAQRCLWELDFELEFHRADVEQSRNEHDLMRDFDQEIVAFTQNERIRETLESCSLLRGAAHLTENLLTCYETLIRAGIIDRKEMELVEAWSEDYRLL